MNVLAYFESLCVDAEAANMLINSRYVYTGSQQMKSSRNF